MSNTGNKAWTTLEQYDVATGVATGIVKPNTIGDPDYVAPVPDTELCPLSLTILEVSPRNYYAPFPSFYFDISIISNSSWVLNISFSWITADIMSGTGNATVRLTASKNDSGRTRSRTVKVRSGTIDRFCSISQESQ
jgi:hypothetical protein